MGKDPPATQRNLEDFAGIASDWFWETDADHRFTYFSSRMEEVTKVCAASILGSRRNKVVGADFGQSNWDAHLEDLNCHRPFRNFEYAIDRPTDGSRLWLRVAGQPLFDDDGTFLGYRGTGHDITHEREAMARLEESHAALAERNDELMEARRELERRANQDSLTSLLNRRAFERDLEEALSVVGNDVILLHIDLDRFKWINDTLGHPAGDAVLVAVSYRIKHIASGVGPVYRVGGDEFVVVLADNAELDTARWIADAILEAVDAPIMVEQHETSVGASVGIAVGTGGQIGPRQLISNADIALYEAKKSGRGRARELTPRLLARIAADRQKASELQRAIEYGEIIPFYQPQVHAGSGAVIGVEALARWQHPTEGLLGPGAFLGIAADMGLVAAIDRSMMQQALRFSEWMMAAGLHLPSVSINLSAGRLRDPRLINDIEENWTDRRCKLSIELLETISFDGLQQEPLMADNLKALRAMGVGIETDDFGSGRASITSLLRVRPDRLKIDRHLVQAAVRDPIKRTVFSAILDMTEALGIEVLAEGVEDKNDIAVIRQLGCEMFQGYAFAKPMPEDAFRAYLIAQNQQLKTQTAGPKDLPKRA